MVKGRETCYQINISLYWIKWGLIFPGWPCAKLVCIKLFTAEGVTQLFAKLFLLFYGLKLPIEPLVKLP